MVDILSGVLTGGNHAGKVKDPFDNFQVHKILDIYLSHLKQTYLSKTILQELRIILKQLKDCLRLKE